MTRLYETPATLSASILDWIPARYHDRIRANTVTAPDDVSDYVEAAVNECGFYELIVPPGVYAISRQLTATNAVRMTGRGATFRATANLDARGDGRGAMFSFNVLAPRIQGISFDMNAKSGNGLFLSSCNTPRIIECGFTNTVAGFAGARGGSVLYGKFDQCTMLGAGRSLDFQKGWEYRVPMTGSPSLTFVSAGVGLGGTITRSAGSWVTDGYTVSDRIRIELAATSTNNTELVITGITATVLTFTAGTLANEGPTAGCVVSQVTGSYYGFHAAQIRECQMYGLEGVRIAGSSAFINTDHEHAIWQPAYRNEKPSMPTPLCAAVVLGEEVSQSDSTLHQYEIRGIYMELAEGTVGQERAFGTLTTGNVVQFDGGQIIGAVGPAAGSTAIFNLLTVGSGGARCSVRRWENGFEGAFSGGANHNGLMDYSRVFVTSDVTNVYKAGTGVQPTETLRPWGHWADVSYSRATGLVQGPNTAYVIHTITPDTAANKIDPTLGRQWHLSAPSPITLGSTYFVAAGVKQGLEFIFTFSNGNITIDNAYIKLRGNANRAFAAGESLRMYVDQAGVIREQGY